MGGSEFQIVEISKYISKVTRICYLNSEVSVVIAYYAPNRYMFLVYRNIRDSADMCRYVYTLENSLGKLLSG